MDAAMTVLLSSQAPAPIFSENGTTPNLAKTGILDKVKHVAGVALAFLGLGILLGSALSLLGYFAGMLAITTEPIHPFFMTGIACTFCGFHLAGGSSASPSINAGPFTFNV